MAGERGNLHHPHEIVRRWSQGAGREVRGAANHAFRLSVDPSPASPWSRNWTRSPSKGGRAGRRSGRRRGERRSATGARPGKRRRTFGAAPFPVAREAEGLAEDLVRVVVDRPRPSAADGIGPQRRGVDFPRLR